LNSLNRIKLCRYTFKSKDVPADFEGVKIIFLTDIHHGFFFTQKKVRALVRLTNSLKPDIIMLGGDYVDRDPGCIPTFYKEAAGFRAPLGIFAVLGNHDIRTDEALSIKCMKQSGIKLLDNDAVWVEKGESRIKIGGVGDLWSMTQNLGPMTEGTVSEDLMILISHNPDFAEILPTNLIDLLLCGHTHGGQVSFFHKWVPPWPGSAKLKYLTGVVKEENTTVIISNGIGTVGPPIRVFASPQIWEITLSKK
jgi:predicted MPP superfamily phosphohydrolase